MSATHFLNDPDNAVEEMLDGYLATHQHLVRRIPGTRVVLRRTPGEGVAVITGGGSGHEPAFLGYVGAGMLDAVVVGDVFASPPVGAVLTAIRAADRGAGVLLLIGNYSGDVMNFTMAADLARDYGIDVEIAIATDDVGADNAISASQRRGVSGQVLIWKACGAAAAQGLPLADIARIAADLNESTLTMGVAASGARVPGTDADTFELEPGLMELGVGHHGERGQASVPMESVDAIVERLVRTIDAELALTEQESVFVLINGLGSTPLLELYIAVRRVRALMEDRGVHVHRAMVGQYFSALQMTGFSVTLTRLTPELTALLDAPSTTPHLTWLGPIQDSVLGTDHTLSHSFTTAHTDTSTLRTDVLAERTRAALLAMCAAVHTQRDALGRLDAALGDGDHGISMDRTFSAVAKNLDQATGNSSQLLELVGDTALNAVGGAMGPLFGSAFLAAGSSVHRALEKDSPELSGGEVVATALAAAVHAIENRGGAVLGDKTMLDALIPAATAAADAAADGTSVKNALNAAAAAARDGAESTTALIARIGRASRLGARTLGCQDAGATSIALVLAALAAGFGAPLDKPVRTANPTPDTKVLS